MISVELRAALLLNAVQAPKAALDWILERGAKQLHQDHDEAFWKELGLTPSKQRELYGLLNERDWAEREMERAGRAGAGFVSIMDADYPESLRSIQRPPLGLYVKGKIERLTAKSAVAIVGTRRCDSYGKSVAEDLGQALANAGFAVVSGGARGIDAAGHRGCLAAGGVTAAVFGTGIDITYPAEHRALFEEIANSGALISEYAMGSEGSPWHFPNRNRIIVGLADRIVVVESPKDGGAMITARIAAEAGREVWSVPGRITDPVCAGTNQLIRDGSQPLIDKDSFLECISGFYGQLMLDMAPPSPHPPAAPAPEEGLSTEDRIVLELLRRQDGQTIDGLMADSELSLPSMQVCIMNLSSRNLVSEVSGRYYVS